MLSERVCQRKQPEGRRRLPALSARVFGVSVSTHHPDAGKCALCVLKIVNFSPYVFILYSRARAFFSGVFSHAAIFSFLLLVFYSIE